MLILLADPFDTGRLALLRANGAAEARAAFAAPSRARDPQFDAAIIGNSRAQLLDPARLSDLTHRNFVQLSVPAAHVAEQAAIAGWFLDHHNGAPVVLLIVLDDTWCSPGPSLRGRPFPFWLYGDTWSYIRNVITPDGLDKAWRRVRLTLGLLERPQRDGYDNYELVKKWDSETAAQRVASPPPLEDANLGRPLPATDVLRGLLGRADPRSQLVLLWPPVHVNALPVDNSPAQARLQECKHSIAAVAHAFANSTMIDWRVRSPLSTDHNNFWDLTHYRGIVARQLEDALANALGQQAQL
jgi:hypothetical protein